MLGERRGLLAELLASPAQLNYAVATTLVTPNLAHGRLGHMQIAMGADHAGYELKTLLLPWLRASGHWVIDVGAHQLDSTDDYPDFAAAVGQAVVSQQAERGILICGSGVGACVTANKVPGVRACLCHDTYTSRQGVEHDDMNVVCLGARVIGPELAKEILRTFLAASFLHEPRFQRRLDKLLWLERQGMPAPGESGGPGP